MGSKKPGPDKYIGDAELFRSRDGIVSWLEDVWPELVQPLLAAANPREVAAVLKKLATFRCKIALPEKLIHEQRAIPRC